MRDKYNRLLLQDFLRARIRDAGFDDAEVTQRPDGTNVTLHVTKPGIVIGRKGSTIRELTESLENDYGMHRPQVSVQELVKPELSPSVMCGRMASHLERGTAFRRAMMWTLQQVMEAGARGVQITVSGKLRGDRSAFEKHTAGILPRAGDHADRIVRDDVIDVKTPMGLIGIRIRIALADRYVAEFDMKNPKDVARRERERERRRRDREERAREEREARERHRERSSRVHDAGAGIGGGGSRGGGSGRRSGAAGAPGTGVDGPAIAVDDDGDSYGAAAGAAAAAALEGASASDAEGTASASGASSGDAAEGASGASSGDASASSGDASASSGDASASSGDASASSGDASASSGDAEGGS